MNLTGVSSTAEEAQTILKRLSKQSMEYIYRYFPPVPSLGEKYRFAPVEMRSWQEPDPSDTLYEDSRIGVPVRNCANEIPIAHEMGSTAIKAAKSPPRIAHLNGLRGLALIGVLMSPFQHTQHARRVFPGVDIFCVLSGYLITSTTLTRLICGGFSPSRFFWGRFWRLCPAFLFTTLCTLVCAHTFFSPEFIAQIARSAYASPLASFGAFSTLEEERTGVNSFSFIQPFLYAWSLSMYWRLYLVWPIVMMCVSRLHRRRRLSLFLTLFLTILIAYGALVVTHGLREALTLLPGSTIAFGLGALVAAAPSVTSSEVGSLMSSLGTAMITFAFIYPSTFQSVPTLLALTTQIGALLVTVSPGTAGVNRLYLFAPLEYLGKISYSAYLMQWPSYVFFHSKYGYNTASTLVCVAFIIVVLALSVLLHQCVENEFRSGKQNWHKLVIACLLLSILMISRHLAFTNGGQLQSSVASRIQLSKEHALKSFVRDDSNEMMFNETQPVPSAKASPDGDDGELTEFEELTFSEFFGGMSDVQGKSASDRSDGRAAVQNLTVVGERPAFANLDLPAAQGEQISLLNWNYDGVLDPRTSRQYFKMAAQDHIATFKPLCINTQTETFTSREEPKLCGGYNRTAEWMIQNCDLLEQSHTRESNLEINPPGTQTTQDWFKDQEGMNNVHWVEGLTVLQMYDISCGNIAHFVGRATMLQHVMEHINAYAPPPHRIENVVILPSVHTMKRFVRPQRYSYWHDTFLRAILAPSQYIVGNLGGFVRRAGTEIGEAPPRVHLLHNFSMAGSNKPDGTVVCFRQAVVPGFFKGRFFAADKEYPSTEAASVRSRLPGAPETPRDALRMREKIGAFLNSSAASFSTMQKRIVFLDRGGARRAIPEKQKEKLFGAVKAAAKKRGFSFEVVSFDEMHFEEQVRAMTNTGIAIGVHGANLVNTMFMVRCFQDPVLSLSFE